MKESEKYESNGPKEGQPKGWGGTLKRRSREKELCAWGNPPPGEFSWKISKNNKGTRKESETRALSKYKHQKEEGEVEINKGLPKRKKRSRTEERRGVQEV